MINNGVDVEDIEQYEYDYPISDINFYKPNLIWTFVYYNKINLYIIMYNKLAISSTCKFGTK